mmetsp:Transcript_104561/g.295856  ORF Transcript_104561/g.295856 Transcript_104561/m.295856 type:complete len:137 (-) Transcript_104561:179-589(-)
MPKSFAASSAALEAMQKMIDTAKAGGGDQGGKSFAATTSALTGLEKLLEQARSGETINWAPGLAEALESAKSKVADGSETNAEVIGKLISGGTASVPPQVKETVSQLQQALAGPAAQIQEKAGPLLQKALEQLQKR